VVVFSTDSGQRDLGDAGPTGPVDGELAAHGATPPVGVKCLIGDPRRVVGLLASNTGIELR
jgi:hypothetical protein